jgi:hypothetical protein
MGNGSIEASGSCLCGKVRYRVAGNLRPVVNCHCTMCLKWHGNFGAYTAASRADLTVEGRENLVWYRSSDHASRGFCRSCGTSLFWRRADSDVISIAAGTLDQPTGLKTVRHIFTEHPADYYEIADDLDQLPRGLG